MRHRHYHCVSARSPAELGHKLGLRFGGIMRRYLEEARESADWYDWVALSKDLLDSTQRSFPGYVEELAAYGEAAKIPISELWALSLGDEFDHGAGHCTTVVTNGGRLLLHNEDWDSYSADAICLLRKTLGELTILELYYYGTPLGGSAVSINSWGNIHAVNSLTHSDRGIGVPKAIVARWLSESREIETNLEYVRGLQRASGYNHVLISSGGTLVDVECSAREMVILHPTAPYVHTNHFLSDQLERMNATTSTPSSVQRYAAAKRIAKPFMSAEELIAVSDDRSGGSECSIMNRNTIAKMLVDLDACAAKVWLRREARAGWITYPLDFLDCA